MVIKNIYNKFSQIIDKSSTELDVSKKLILATIMTESSGNPMAFRYEDGYKWLLNVTSWAKKHRIPEQVMKDFQSSSWGLMQVMGANYYVQGGQYLPFEMLNPDKGVWYGTKMLKSFTKKYKDPFDIYAAYNAGSVIRREGAYKNQAAVNNFKSFYVEIDFLE